MSKIKDIRGREIIDSRGNPTVEADVVLESGGARARRRALGRLDRHARSGRAARRRQASATSARACSRPSGTSTPCCSKALLGMRRRATRQASIARMIELDGTDTKGRLGANALLAVSLANAHAAAPTRSSRCTGYLGEHGGPRAGDAGADDEHHQRRRARQQQPRHPGVHDPAGRRAELSRGAALRRGDLPHAQEDPATSAACRPRWATRAASRPTCESNEAALEIILRGDREGRLQGRQGHLPRPRRGQLRVLQGRPLRARVRRTALHVGASSPTTWPTWLRSYPIVTIEDGMGEGDWDGWAHAHRARSASKIQLVGDDLFVTNTKILKRGHRASSIANAILIKPNQIGTLTETLAAIDMADKAHYASVVSHRSGETEDAPSPTSRWRPRPRRSRPARCRARTAWPSTTSCCASRRSSAQVRYAGRDAFPVKI